jgi:hypothetical protein
VKIFVFEFATTMHGKQRLKLFGVATRQVAEQQAHGDADRSHIGEYL